MCEENTPRLPFEMQKTADDRGRVHVGKQFANRTLRIRIEDGVDPLDLPVYFTRYKVDLSVAGKAKMLAENRAGMDWGTGPVDASDDYDVKGKGAREDRDALVTISDEMGLLVAAPETTAPDRVKIGPVPQQPIETRPYEYIQRDETDNIEQEEMLSLGEQDDPATDYLNHAALTQRPDTPRVYMKTIKMDPNLTVTVTQDEAPALFDRNARPRNTIRRWRSKTDAVRDAYRKATYPNPYQS